MEYLFIGIGLSSILGIVRFFCPLSTFNSILLGVSWCFIFLLSPISLSLVLVIGAWVYYVVYHKKTKVVRYLSSLGIVSLFFILKSTINTLEIIGFTYYSLQLLSILLYPPEQESNWKSYFIALCLFPKFSSGPILAQNKIYYSQHILEDWSIGIKRIVWGLSKKFILSNRLAPIIAAYFDYPEQATNSALALTASLLFTLQMYCDFSAFTDIALGCGRLLGIQLPENFKRPLSSKSITEYWRKTHITLITWLTQHIYYPIVYTFKKNPKTAIVAAIFLTFILSGLWHQLAWGFILWGIINATGIVLEFVNKNNFKGINKLGISRLYVWLWVSVANYFFYLSDSTIIQKACTRLLNIPVLPLNFMQDYVAILGRGGYLEQQYHLLETLLLIILFLLFEKKIEFAVYQTKFKVRFFVFLLICIFVFGNFASSNSFIYLQF